MAQSKVTVPLTQTSAITWLIGLAGTWVILTALAEFDDTRELAVAFAVLILLTVLMLHGPDALKNLGALPAQGYPASLERATPTTTLVNGGY